MNVVKLLDQYADVSEKIAKAFELTRGIRIEDGRDKVWKLDGYDLHYDYEEWEEEAEYMYESAILIKEIDGLIAFRACTMNNDPVFFIVDRTMEFGQ